MKSILKTVKQLETTNEVLEYIENVISKIKDSDHYPIFCWLKKRGKP